MRSRSEPGLGVGSDDGAEDIYGQILSVLRQHVSSLNAQSMLHNAIHDAGMTRDRLGEGNVHHVLRRLSRGLLLFAGADHHRAAMASLGALAQRPKIEADSISIEREADISRARLAARLICERFGVERFVVQKAATITSELARNIVLYAGRGVIELVPFEEDPPRLLVRATDEGPGIKNLETILSGRYRSRTGLGKGLLGTKRLASRFDVQTGPTGTFIEAEVRL